MVVAHGPTGIGFEPALAALISCLQASFGLSLSTTRGLVSHGSERGRKVRDIQGYLHGRMQPVGAGSPEGGWAAESRSNVVFDHGAQQGSETAG
jgi:hypothetical protein